MIILEVMVKILHLLLNFKHLISEIRKKPVRFDSDNLSTLIYPEQGV